MTETRGQSVDDEDNNTDYNLNNNYYEDEEHSDEGYCDKIVVAVYGILQG